MNKITKLLFASSILFLIVFLGNIPGNIEEMNISSKVNRQKEPLLLPEFELLNFNIQSH